MASTTQSPSVPSRNRTPGGFPHLISQVLLAITFIVGIASVAVGQIHDFGAVWTVLLSAAALAVSIWVTPRHFVVGFLTSLLPFLTVWRVAAMAGGASVLKGDGSTTWAITGPRPWALMIVSAVTLVTFVLEFAFAWYHDLTHRSENKWLLNLVWGAALVRIYFGYNEVGHATEKIFAGYASWEYMTNSVFGPLGTAAVGPFALLGKAPGVFVVIAGIVEIGVGLLVGAGLLTRLGGAGGVAYLLLATLPYGGEWGHGYGWSGGGWEYPMLLIVFFLSLVLTGAGPFSIDHRLFSTRRLPAWARPLSVTRSVEVTAELTPR
jgi:putative oxidoreductase